jgi:hypothetical protein
VEAREVARALLEAEARGGFARLRRVPSSLACRFLEYYDELPSSEAAELREALVDRGGLSLRPVPGQTLPVVPAYDRWTAALMSGRFARPRHLGLRLARNAASAGLADQFGFTAEEAAELAATRPATAAQLRKLVAPVLAERFGLCGEKLGGGEWKYTREDGSLAVRLDFGGQGDQLRYRVSARDAASGGRIAFATYEGVLGLFGGWDWIEEAAAPAAVELLAELVALLAELPERLAGP